MGPWWWPLLWWLHAVLLLGGAQQPPASPSPGVPTSEPGPSGDAEGSVAALAFLRSGDAQRLARANCSRDIVAGAPGSGPPPALRAALRAAPEALAQAANFLNMLFQSNDIREASVAEDVEWYQALVRSLAEGHPWVRRAVLALDAHPLAAKPRLMLQATAGEGEIRLRDVSAAAPSLGNRSWDNEWFNALRAQRSPQLRKRVLSNDLPGHVRWSPPFLECQDGKFLPAWAVTLSSAFYGLKPDLSPEFKGVVRVDIELRDVGIDQCASGPGWFAGTHRCDLNSTQCVPQESRGFVLGQYECRCKPGFYGAGVAGSAVPADGGPRLACRPCREGCASCVDDTPCLIQEDRALRAAILSCQASCMLAVFLSMLVSYHFRRSKRIRASGVVLLETILFGSLLLYFPREYPSPVFILYFKPSIFRCIVLRWVRMLGFATVYGTIALKLYRVLRVFLARTAQRVPYMSSGRVLKMLGLILLLVLWFLAAWTVGMLENVDKNIPLVVRTQTPRGLHFYICGHDRWDYMMVVAEMLFLLWGSSLCYATRAVPSAFHEPRYMGIALHNDCPLGSPRGCPHTATLPLPGSSWSPRCTPDWTLLLFFAHTHSTVTMTLALIFIPKFLHAGSPLREEIAAEVYEDELDMRRSGSCLNSSIASAWSERSLDPDDIREELKKLYAQLEVLKTRRMAANNPHLPKKRGSRRSLGRSLVRRLAELPEAVAPRGSREERLRTPGSRRASAKRLPSTSSASLRARDGGFPTPRRLPCVNPAAPRPQPWDPRGGSPDPSPSGDTAPGTPVVTTAGSGQSDSESLDAAPLVCKSASAHDLSGHQQPPQPRAALLLKSLSVVAGARDEALLVASRAARDGRDAERGAEHRATQRPGRPRRRPPCGTRAWCTTLGTAGRQRSHQSHPWGHRGEHTPRRGRARLQSARSIPAEVCPWELIQEEILSRKQKACRAFSLRDLWGHPGGPPEPQATLPENLQEPGTGHQGSEPLQGEKQPERKEGERGQPQEKGARWRWGQQEGEAQAGRDTDFFSGGEQPRPHKWKPQAQPAGGGRGALAAQQQRRLHVGKRSLGGQRGTGRGTGGRHGRGWRRWRRGARRCPGEHRHRQGPGDPLGDARGLAQQQPWGHLRAPPANPSTTTSTTSTATTATTAGTGRRQPPGPRAQRGCCRAEG
uniref:G-protein coupled receptors family 3 profile domain-containing protein n=1 Tax=Anas platyrhynchos TaxID=8839 RepID=A0A8B9Z9D3_ANAPL